MLKPQGHRCRLLLVRDARFESLIAPTLTNSAIRLEAVDSLSEAHDQIWNRAPDLMLLESCAEHHIAAEFCQQLRLFFQFPILVIEQSASEAERITLLDSGADDIVSANSSFAELLARFNALLRRVSRQQRLDPHSHYLQAITMQLDIAGRRLILEGRQIDLSLSLIKLLAMLFCHQEAFVSREEIAQHIFGTVTPASQARVSALVNLLRRRIEQELGLPSIIVGVMGRGYRLAPTFSES